MNRRAAFSSLRGAISTTLLRLLRKLRRARVRRSASARRRKQRHRLLRDGLLRGACHRAALCADPLARNDDVAPAPTYFIRRFAVAAEASTTLSTSSRQLKISAASTG